MSDRRRRASLVAALLLATLSGASARAETNDQSLVSSLAPQRTMASVVLAQERPRERETPRSQQEDSQDERDERGWWPWDWPGRARDAIFGGVAEAINDWFRGIIESALTPVFDLFARTVFTTPEVTSHPRVQSLWQVSLGLAVAALLLFVTTAAGILIANGGVETRVSAKEVLPRLVVAAVATSFSLVAVAQGTRLSNAVSEAILGSGGDPDSVSRQMGELVSGALTNPFLALLGLVVVVLGLFVIAVYLLRVAVLIVLVAGAPLLLVCHALPHTDGVARMWWKAVAAVLCAPIAQALVLATALRIVLSGDLPGLSSSSLVDLLVVSVLLYLMFKIPLLLANAVKTGSGSRTLERTKTVFVQAGKAVTAA